MCVARRKPRAQLSAIFRMCSAPPKSPARMPSILAGGSVRERAHFAEVCESIGIKFIGLTSENIVFDGDKSKAREVVATKASRSPPAVLANSGANGTRRNRQDDRLPVIIKASAGGGGRGMRVVNKPGRTRPAFRAAQAEAKSTFAMASISSGTSSNPGTIEVQIVADNRGHVVHLGESVIARFTSSPETGGTPSPTIDERLRREIGRTAVEAVKTIPVLRNVGTVEFLLDRIADSFFMEVNTRIQVEHPITEMVTGIDLVKEQIPLPQACRSIQATGHQTKWAQF